VIFDCKPAREKKRKIPTRADLGRREAQEYLILYLLVPWKMAILIRLIIVNCAGVNYSLKKRILC
jgi:hypothetical protein